MCTEVISWEAQVFKCLKSWVESSYGGPDRSNYWTNCSTGQGWRVLSRPLLDAKLLIKAKEFLGERLTFWK